MIKKLSKIKKWKPLPRANDTAIEKLQDTIERNENINIIDELRYDVMRSYNWVELEREALEFAIEKHSSINQRRKYSNKPYMVHPVRVALTLKVHGHPEETVAAALLHDVLEDVPTSQEEFIALKAEIQLKFGEVVTSRVLMVTDISKKSDGNRKVRKEIDRQHLAEADAEGQSIKLSDLIDNIGSIVEHDRGFAYTYLREKEAMLEVLTLGNPDLYEIASTLLQYSKEEIGLN